MKILAVIVMLATVALLWAQVRENAYEVEILRTDLVAISALVTAASLQDCMRAMAQYGYTTSRWDGNVLTTDWEWIDQEGFIRDYPWCAEKVTW